MPSEKLPGMIHRSKWKEVTKGQAETRWDSVVNEVRKGTEGNGDKILVFI